MPGTARSGRALQRLAAGRRSARADRGARRPCVQNSVMDASRHCCTYFRRQIVAFVTYRRQDATASQQVTPILSGPHGAGIGDRDKWLAGVWLCPPGRPMLGLRISNWPDGQRHGMRMEDRRSSFDYEDLLACGRGELFGDGQRPVAAAADADVRPHLRDRGGRRRVRQGPGARGARPQAGPLVLPLPLQGRSGDAGLPRPRCALAAARLLPRLARLARQGPRARLGEVKFSGQVLPTVKQVDLRHRHQAGHALEARARHRRWLAQGRRLDHLSGEGPQGRPVPHEATMQPSEA